ncbi:DUF1826 domain-containing protein [Paracoccus sp. (in: a-proteobacteria)]|uniref:DUF1826 domain-containing protein n=1 Tax=Paracoccus sp. TaxID=267 RepID=UPI0028A5A777|nr:DUF1826 domain-containing protein [Paracoccus sp. (in: a-proteobacteria)]
MSFGRAQNVVPFWGPSEARAILQGRDPSILSQIGAPGIGAAIWQREPLAEFLDWIETQPVANLPSLRTLVAVDAVEACIHAACESAQTPASRMRDMLVSDIAALAYIMSEIMQTPLLHLRLDIGTTDACRRFHVDNLTARMLCTYRGAGTQIAQPGQENAPLDLITAAAAILRGTLWPGREKTGLLHRSPPISGTGQSRLLLVIDPGTDYRPGRAVH